MPVVVARCPLSAARCPSPVRCSDEDRRSPLCALPNYVITRRDGTTAAERFAGKKHGDLFAHLVAITPTPARPRVRSRKVVEPMLAAA